MKRSVIIIVSLIFFSGHAFGQEIADFSNTQEQHLPDKEVIEKLVAVLDSAWNNRDAQLFASLFTIDGDFQFYTGQTLQGRENIENYYRTTVFPGIPQDWRHISTATHLRFVRDDVAIGDAEVQITSVATQEKEKQLILFVFATSVLVKEQDNWYIAAVRLMVPQAR